MDSYIFLLKKQTSISTELTPHSPTSAVQRCLRLIWRSSASSPEPEGAMKNATNQILFWAQTRAAQWVRNSLFVRAALQWRSRLLSAMARSGEPATCPTPTVRSTRCRVSELKYGSGSGAGRWSSGARAVYCPSDSLESDVTEVQRPVFKKHWSISFLSAAAAKKKMNSVTCDL